MVFGLFRKKNKKSETSEPINNNPDFITNDHPKRGEPVEKEVSILPIVPNQMNLTYAVI